MMKSLAKITIIQQADWALLIVIIMAITLFTFIIYRRTNPVVNPIIKNILTFLRWAALALVVLIIQEPIVRLIFSRHEKATIAILIDNSASMSLEDNGVKRASMVHQFLTSPAYKNLDQRYNVEIFTFSNRLSDAPVSQSDSIRYDGSGTDIQTALEELTGLMAEKYWTATILLSDGVYNIGANPIGYVREINKPVYPIAIGDPNPKKDLLIVNVLANEVSYIDNKSPIEVRLRNNGFENIRVPVVLKQNEKILDSQQVQFLSTPSELSVNLHFIPKEEGMQHYTVEVSQQEEEATYKNNSRVFYTNVLKSKLKVMLLAGAPSSDLAFLARILKNDENIEPEVYVEKQSGRFYQTDIELEHLDNFDIFLLLNFPTRQTAPDLIDHMLKVCQQKMKAIFVMVGDNVAADRLVQFSDLLPFNGRLLQTIPTLVTVQPSYQNKSHPILTFSGNEKTHNFLHQLPPVYQNYQPSTLWPDAQILLTVTSTQPAKEKDRTVFLVARQFGKQKSIALFAHQWWRWDLMMWGINQTNDIYAHLITNSLKWLATGIDEKRVRVSTNKQIYHNREEIYLTAQVYEENYTPASDVNVNATINKREKETQINFTATGTGIYKATTTMIEPGDYQCIVKADRNGVIMGTDQTKFTVGEFNLEMQDVKMNAPLLQGLAAASGGRYVTMPDLALLENKLDFPTKNVQLANELELFDSKILLISIILLLSFEWFLRKRKGMV